MHGENKRKENCQMSCNDSNHIDDVIDEILNCKERYSYYDLSKPQFPDVVITNKKETINHPDHYTPGVYEVINVIEAWGLDFHLGNAIKYIARAGKKDPSKKEEDLRKAVWYIERYIQNKD